MEGFYSADYLRYRSQEIDIGGLRLGGLNPVRIQSMTNTPTRETESTVDQVLRLVEAGCELVRITARNRREATHLSEIKTRLKERGISVPLIADIHFMPEAALEAARRVEKVRINPGNYERTDLRTEDALNHLSEELNPLIRVCKEYGTAIRVGVNQGSLSRRIVEQFGNTIEGLVASAIEYISVIKGLGFNKLVVSIKSSHPATGIRANRLLANEMYRQGYSCPIHIGVTEAGFGADGVLRSILGLGPLLIDGLGDTMRVSLTGDPVKEIPVAKSLRDISSPRLSVKGPVHLPYDPIHPKHRDKILVLGDAANSGLAPDIDVMNQAIPNSLIDEPFIELNNESLKRIIGLPGLEQKTFMLSPAHESHAYQLALSLKQNYPTSGTIASIDPGNVIKSGYYLSKPLFDGLIDAIWPDGSDAEVGFRLLQAAGLRRTHVEIISCPSCGRTQFDLETMARKVQESIRHLKNIKVAVMGCIVNGPGEMEDADYGYVGAGKGKVHLYRHGDCVMKNLDEEEAIESLLRLIESDMST